jgi:hypothetical protein
MLQFVTVEHLEHLLHRRLRIVRAAWIYRRLSLRNPADHNGSTDHVSGALLALRASGHVYLPSAVAL